MAWHVATSSKMSMSDDLEIQRGYDKNVYFFLCFLDCTVRAPLGKHLLIQVIVCLSMERLAITNIQIIH